MALGASARERGQGKTWGQGNFSPRETRASELKWGIEGGKGSPIKGGEFKNMTDRGEEENLEPSVQGLFLYHI